MIGWLAALVVVGLVVLLAYRVFVDVVFLLAVQVGCLCSRHRVDSRCPLHGWQSVQPSTEDEGKPSRGAEASGLH